MWLVSVQISHSWHVFLTLYYLARIGRNFPDAPTFWPKWSIFVYTSARQLKVSECCPLSHSITWTHFFWLVSRSVASQQYYALQAHFLFIPPLQITLESLLALSLTINHCWGKNIVTAERGREKVSGGSIWGWCVCFCRFLSWTHRDRRSRSHLQDS